jgi:radical SAM-linked protein
MRPSYSEGFNPHPKMSFALPLSLGFESVSEYLDVETDRAADTASAKELLNKRLPKGIEVLGISEKDIAISGSLASHVKFAEYEVLAPYTGKGEDDPAAFLAQPSVLTEKESRKTGRISQMDIRPQIAKFEVTETFNSFIRYKAVLASNSGNLLNPRVLIDSYYTYLGLKIDLSDLGIMRTSIILS